MAWLLVPWACRIMMKKSRHQQHRQQRADEQSEPLAGLGRLLGDHGDVRAAGHRAGLRAGGPDVGHQAVAQGARNLAGPLRVAAIFQGDGELRPLLDDLVDRACLDESEERVRPSAVGDVGGGRARADRASSPGPRAGRTRRGTGRSRPAPRSGVAASCSPPSLPRRPPSPPTGGTAVGVPSSRPGLIGRQAIPPSHERPRLTRQPLPRHRAPRSDLHRGSGSPVVRRGPGGRHMVRASSPPVATLYGDPRRLSRGERTERQPCVPARRPRSQPRRLVVVDLHRAEGLLRGGRTDRPVRTRQSGDAVVDRDGRQGHDPDRPAGRELGRYTRDRLVVGCLDDAHEVMRPEHGPLTEDRDIEDCKESRRRSA